MTIEEASKIIKDYDNLIKEGKDLGYGWFEENVKDTIKTMEILGVSWGEKIRIPKDFSVIKGKPYLLNSKTHFNFSENENYIVWDNGNVGRLQFGDFSSELYREIDEEWEEFEEKLLSYGALDYDPMNCKIIYNIENGKKLMHDYDDICGEVRSKIKVKAKKFEIEKMKRELEKLQREL